MKTTKLADFQICISRPLRCDFSWARYTPKYTGAFPGNFELRYAGWFQVKRKLVSGEKLFKNILKQSS